MSTFMQDIKIAPPDPPTDGNPPDDDLEQRAKLPPLLFAAPCVGSLLLLIWGPSIGGIIAAFAWGALSLALATGVFTVSQNRLMYLLPRMTNADAGRMARFCMAPIWITEALRMVVAFGVFCAGKGEPISVFRTVFKPSEWLSNPTELITVAGLAATAMRVYFSVRQHNSVIGPTGIAAAVLPVFAVLLLTFALSSIAGAFALASTMTLRFM